MGWVVGAVLVVATLVSGTACGSGDDDRATVAAGPTAAPPGPAAPGPASGPAAPPTAGGEPTTTVAPPGDPGPSPVEGLDASQLLAAVTAPAPAPVARAGGPTADRVVLADGRAVWRVRVPGPFPARTARATIAVAGRDLGTAVTPPDLSALVVVVPSADGLVAGAAVTYRWEGSEPVAAGALEAVR